MSAASIKAKLDAANARIRELEDELSRPVDTGYSGPHVVVHKRLFCQLHERIRELEAELRSRTAHLESVFCGQEMLKAELAKRDERIRELEADEGTVTRNTIVAWLRSTPKCLRHGNVVYGPYQDAAELLADALEQDGGPK